MRASGASARARSRVSAIRGCPLASGSSCVGRSGVLTGQKREAIPPASTTTQTWSSAGTEDLTNAGDQLLGAERFRHEIIGAAGERGLPIGVLSLGGQDDHRRGAAVGIGPDLRENLEA